ncbi:hypothetical protein [Cohaesibacter gelatinilyticus]|uniref:hypothetical protein n=1 Tax=Cohaesibacter gelatinilyticus TaxID=372072 RepID=UPI0014837DE0|nr:hypothetical protein [Cohaesibacter gelatinilyticus]
MPEAAEDLLLTNWDDAHLVRLDGERFIAILVCPILNYAPHLAACPVSPVDHVIV